MFGVCACGAGRKFFGEGGSFFGVVDWCDVSEAGMKREVASLVDVAVDDTGGLGPFDSAAVSLRVVGPLLVASAAVWSASLTGDAMGGTVCGGAVANPAGAAEVDMVTG